MQLLKLIRYKNLLFIVLLQCLIKFVLFEAYKLETTLSNIHFVLLLLATLCIAAGGYIINDIFDVRIDAINKADKQIVSKHISEKMAYNYYIFFTAIGVCLGFYLSNHIGFPGFSALFILLGAFLYVYATYLKSVMIIGNLVVSFLVASTILIVGLFELFPNISSQNILLHQEVFRILLNYSLFAFLLTLLREIIKDIEDINGDQNGGLKTLPILIGRRRTTFVALAFGAFLTILILVYMYSTLYRQTVALLYFLFLVIGPLLYFNVKIFSAEKKEDFSNLSSLLKFIMLTGILSLLLYKFNFI